MLSYYELKISTNRVSSLNFIKELLSPYSVRHYISLPKKYKRFVVIKSPHVNKKSKEHFQILKYNRLFFVYISTLELKNFFLNTPNDISVRIRKIEKQVF